MMEQAALSTYVKMIRQKFPHLVEMVAEVLPYRMPKGYMRWDWMSAFIALNLSLYENGGGQQDLPTRLMANRMALWFLQKAPVYCVSLELLRAFERADLSNVYELFEGFECPVPTLMLAFPQNALAMHNGATVDFAVMHLADVSRPEDSEAEGYGLKISYLPHDGDRNLHISAIDSQSYSWVSGLTLSRKGKLYDSGKILGKYDLSELELDDSGKLKKVCLQCLLALVYAPKLLEVEPAEQPVRPSGRHQARPTSKPATLRPRWLRSKPQATKPKRPHQGGSHASPIPHWRSAYERRVPVGPRAEGRREVMQFKAAWINPDAD